MKKTLCLFSTSFGWIKLFFPLKYICEVSGTRLILALKNVALAWDSPFFAQNVRKESISKQIVSWWCHFSGQGRSAEQQKVGLAITYTVKIYTFFFLHKTSSSTTFGVIVVTAGLFLTINRGSFYWDFKTFLSASKRFLFPKNYEFSMVYVLKAR